MSEYPDETVQLAQRLNIRAEAVKTYLDAGRGVIADGVVRSFHSTIKPAGARCNLNCTYCYYLSKEELLSQNDRCISDADLEKLVSDVIQSQDTQEITFTWHGGEPTLLGLEFFRRVVELQAKHCPPGRQIANDLQTNGILLDDAWGTFLAEQGFLVGLSIDGPRTLHDSLRPTKGGQPSFERAIAAAQILDRCGVLYGALCTVNRCNGKQPLDVYRCLRDEVGARFIQFTPCVEPKGFECNAPNHQPSATLEEPLLTVTDWSVEPHDWGKFLVQVFDEWFERDRGKVKINLFENLLAQISGKPAILCSSSPICGKSIAIESDGRVYSCDHFVYPEHELGTIRTHSLARLIFSPQQLAFGLDKFNSLTKFCKKCPYLRLCWGECPRTRLLQTPQNDGRVSYLCHGWRYFYHNVLPRLGVKHAGVT